MDIIILALLLTTAISMSSRRRGSADFTAGRRSC